MEKTNSELLDWLKIEEKRVKGLEEIFKEDGAKYSAENYRGQWIAYGQTIKFLQGTWEE